MHSVLPLQNVKYWNDCWRWYDRIVDCLDETIAAGSYLFACREILKEASAPM